MVSFIIAVYNGAAFLRETVACALNQKNTEVEVILIDDGSSDSSVALAQELAADDSRVRSLQNSENMGFCRTVNRGIREARGEFVIVLDQDDLLELDHCEKMLAKFTDDSIVMTFCDQYFIDETGKIFDTAEHCQHRDFTIHDLIMGNVIPNQGLVLRRKILAEVGGYPEIKKYPHYGEYHTWIRMAKRGNIAFCGDVKAYYRKHSQNMTNNFTDPHVQLRLERYFWTCRRQLVSCGKLSLKEKLYVVLSTVKRIVRAELRVLLKGGKHA